MTIELTEADRESALQALDDGLVLEHVPKGYPREYIIKVHLAALRSLRAEHKELKDELGRRSKDGVVEEAKHFTWSSSSMVLERSFGDPICRLPLRLFVKMVREGVERGFG